MGSYRHAAHAGNFADVFKHLLLGSALRAALPAGALTYLESHAGAGFYPRAAARPPPDPGGAAQPGPAGLTPSSPPEVARYARLLQRAGRRRPGYPGSPLQALSLLRGGDRAELFESDPAEAAALRRQVAGDRRVRVHRADGYRGVLRRPVRGRALLLIDPPYQQAGDYLRAVATARRFLRLHPGAVVMVWYPLQCGNRHRGLVRRLRRAGRPRPLHCRLCLHPSATAGLYGCGALVLNPPPRLRGRWRAVQRWLADRPGNRRGELTPPRGTQLPVR